jgi:hypothetical protein
MNFLRVGGGAIAQIVRNVGYNLLNCLNSLYLLLVVEVNHP